MRILTGFAIINDRIGERVTYSYDEVDEKGNIIKTNVKGSYLAVEQDVKDAIDVLKPLIESRMNED